MAATEAASRYAEVRRAQARATRKRILVAATDTFTTLGYAGSTMRTVASAAAVALPTVELVFGTKAALLKAVIDTSIAGDDLPTAVLDRPWTQRAAVAANPEAFLTIAAEVLRSAQIRSAALQLVAEEAASSDPGLAAVVEELKAQRLGTATWLVEQISGRWPLRPELDPIQAVDTVWALMDAAIFLRLTRDRQWSSEVYAGWFRDTVRHLLLRDSS